MRKVSIFNMSILAFIGACLIGMWIFSYLGDRHEGKSEKESFDGDLFSSVAVVNMKASFWPNWLINRKLASSQKEFPRTTELRMFDIWMGDQKKGDQKNGEKQDQKFRHPQAYATNNLQRKGKKK